MNIDPILALDLRPTIKHVMTVLTFRAYEDCFEAHMDYARLVTETGLSRRAVKTAIQELKELGLIEAKSKWGRGNYNIYIINMEKVREMHPLAEKKGASAAPLPDEKGANGAPFTEKNLSGEKGANNVEKGANFALKGANNVKKGASAAPIKLKNKKNKTRAHVREGKLPPRTGPVGPAAKEGKRVPAVNRTGGAGGVMPQFDKTTNDRARDMWSHCLQGKTSDFRIPESALLGPIEDGKAYIFNLNGFQRDQINQIHERFILADRLSKLNGSKVELALITGRPQA
ncbi:hypothetical protein [Kordiimonas sp.]|uniref:hypothetical protein n=1 Tax=Kordiimonas sp. TaxID=1970157 RepID=UPI003A8ED07F